MRIVATADLHGDLPHWHTIPECDLLIIAGDVCWDGLVRDKADWLNNHFRPWLESLKAARIVGIAGNHDFVFERIPNTAEKLPWTYLRDSATEVCGAKVWGVPWVPNLSRWAFHLDDADLQRKFDEIPNDVDIVVSHGPPFLHCDFTAPQFGSVNSGFPGTLRMLDRVKPKLFICGHIHEGYGWSTYKDTLVLNVAHRDERYVPKNSVVTLDFEDGNVKFDPSQIMHTHPGIRFSFEDSSRWDTAETVESLNECNP